MKINFVGGGSEEVTVASRAEENVCPKEWGEQFATYKPDKWLTFKGADGGIIKHHGQRDVKVVSAF